MATPPKIQTSELVNNGLVVRRDLKTNQIRSLNTIYDVNIGVEEKAANIIVSGKSKFGGPSYFENGALGVFVLPDGTNALQGSDTVSITEISKGKFKFEAVNNFDLTDIENSILENANSIGVLTASVNNIDDRLTIVEQLSLTASQDIQDIYSTITTKFNEIDTSISSMQSRIGGLENYSGGVGVNIAMNDSLAGIIDNQNTQFQLANAPSPASSLMVFKNGQLMTSGSEADYTLTGSIVNFCFPPIIDDVLLAMYAYQTQVTSYSINEPCSLNFEQQMAIIELANAPVPESSTMIFMNGQLLTANEDYTLSGKIVTINNSLVDKEYSRFFATYSC